MTYFLSSKRALYKALPELVSRTIGEAKVKPQVVALIVGLAAAFSVSAQVYQWKDKDGRTHFSDMPPPNQSGVQAQPPKRSQPPAMVIEPEPFEPETTEDVEEGAETEKAAVPAPASAQEKSEAQQRDEEFRKRRAAAAEAREKADKDAANATQRQQDCQRARAQHAALASGQRIAQPTESGGRKMLNDEERAAEVARVRELMETFCGKD
jgi:hypothetical protein